MVVSCIKASITVTVPTFYHVSLQFQIEHDRASFQHPKPEGRKYKKEKKRIFKNILFFRGEDKRRKYKTERIYYQEDKRTNLCSRWILAKVQVTVDIYKTIDGKRWKHINRWIEIKRNTINMNRKTRAVFSLDMDNPHPATLQCSNDLSTMEEPIAGQTERKTQPCQSFPH